MQAYPCKPPRSPPPLAHPKLHHPHAPLKQLHILHTLLLLMPHLSAPLHMCTLPLIPTPPPTPTQHLLAYPHTHMLLPLLARPSSPMASLLQPPPKLPLKLLHPLLHRSTLPPQRPRTPLPSAQPLPARPPTQMPLPLSLPTALLLQSVALAKLLALPLALSLLPLTTHLSPPTAPWLQPALLLPQHNVPLKQQLHVPRHQSALHTHNRPPPPGPRTHLSHAFISPRAGPPPSSPPPGTPRMVRSDPPAPSAFLPRQPPATASSCAPRTPRQCSPHPAAPLQPPPQ